MEFSQHYACSLHAVFCPPVASDFPRVAALNAVASSRSSRSSCRRPGHHRPRRRDRGAGVRLGLEDAGSGRCHAETARASESGRDSQVPSVPRARARAARSRTVFFRLSGGMALVRLTVDRTWVAGGFESAHATPVRRGTFSGGRCAGARIPAFLITVEQFEVVAGGCRRMMKVFWTFLLPAGRARLAAASPRGGPAQRTRSTRDERRRGRGRRRAAPADDAVALDGRLARGAGHAAPGERGARARARAAAARRRRRRRRRRTRRGAERGGARAGATRPDRRQADDGRVGRARAQAIVDRDSGAGVVALRLSHVLLASEPMADEVLATARAGVPTSPSSPRRSRRATSRARTAARSGGCRPVTRGGGGGDDGDDSSRRRRLPPQRARAVDGDAPGGRRRRRAARVARRQVRDGATRRRGVERGGRGGRRGVARRRARARGRRRVAAAAADAGRRRRPTAPAPPTYEMLTMGCQRRRRLGSRACPRRSALARGAGRADERRRRRRAAAADAVDVNTADPRARRAEVYSHLGPHA